MSDIRYLTPDIWLQTNNISHLTSYINSRRLPSDVWYQTWHQTSIIRHLMTSDKHQTSDIWHKTSVIRHQTSDIRRDIRHQTSDIRHMTSDIRRLTSDVWCQTSDIRQQTSDDWHYVWITKTKPQAQLILLNNPLDFVFRIINFDY